MGCPPPPPPPPPRFSQIPRNSRSRGKKEGSILEIGLIRKLPVGVYVVYSIKDHVYVGIETLSADVILCEQWLILRDSTQTFFQYFLPRNMNTPAKTCLMPQVQKEERMSAISSYYFNDSLYFFSWKLPSFPRILFAINLFSLLLSSR